MSRTTLVGRSNEYERLCRKLKERSRGPIVVRGPAGIGKSRLVTEAVDDRRRVKWLQARAEQSLLPLHNGPHRVGDDFGSVTVRIRDDLAGTEPGVLVVDDAHHLDAGATAILVELVNDAHVSVVLTVRDGEELSSSVQQLVASGDELALEPLPDDAVETLVENVAESPVAAPANGHIQRLAQGNPLYARELTLDAIRRGQLAERADGMLDLDGALEAPSELSSLIRRRIADLPVDAALLLRQLVLAEPLPLKLTSRLAVGRTFATLDRAGLTSVTNGAVQLFHPLIADVVADQIGRAERAELSAALLETIGRDHPDGVFRAAVWAVAAETQDPQLLVDGARIAAARLDHELAQQLASRAIDVGAGSEAHLLLAAAIAASPDGADEAETRLAALEPQLEDPVQRSRASFERARNLLFGLGQPELAVDAAERSLESRADGPWHVEVRAIAALAAMLTGQVDRAVAVGEGLAAAGEDRRSRATVEVMVTLARTLAGRLDGTRQRIELAQELLGELPELEHLPLAREQLGLTTAYLYLYTGDVEKAGVYTEGQLRRVLDEGGPLAGTWLAMASHVALNRGDLVEVVRLGTDAIAALEQIDLLRTLPLALAQVAFAEALLGRVAIAEQHLARIHANDQDLPDRILVNVGRAEAAVLAAQGDLDAAVDRAIAAGDSAYKGQHRVWAAFAYHDAMRFGGGERCYRALVDVASEMDEGLVSYLVAGAKAWVRGDAAGLVSAGDDLLRAGARLAAAETYLAVSTCAEQVGDREVERCRRRAAAVLGGGPRTWLMADAPPEVMLGEREKQVALLATNGLSNNEIALKLVVAPRTVENQLASVYRKLGATSRGDLALLMRTR